MNYILDSIIASILFVLLIPGNIIRIPSKGSKMINYLIHGVIFFVIYLLVKLLSKDKIFEGIEPGSEKTRKPWWNGATLKSAPTSGNDDRFVFKIKKAKKNEIENKCPVGTFLTTIKKNEKSEETENVCSNVCKSRRKNSNVCNDTP
jgi:hypothetical protein